MIFSGELLSLEPAEIKPGRPINLVAKWTVATSSPIEVITGWEAEFVIALDGLEGKSSAGVWDLIGFSRKTFTHMINVGPDVMPSYGLTGYATITCWKGGFSSYYEVVYNEPIVLASAINGGGNGGNGGGNGGNGEEGEGKFPLIPVAIGVGVVAVAVAAVTRR